MTLTELKSYIKRYLGDPMIHVELDDTQIDDRIRDTLELFMERHYDGSIETYYLLDLTKDTYLYTLPDDVMAVTGVYLEKNNLDIKNENILLSTKHEMYQNTFELNGSSITLMRMQYDTLDQQYREDYMFDFNATTHTLSISKNIESASTVYLRVFVKQDMSNDNDKSENIYADRWVKQMSCAMCKKQWGTNITKYVNVPLPGGGTINGEKIYSDGENEIEKAMQDLNEIYTRPAMFFKG